MKNPDIFITLFKWGIRISIVAVVIIIGLGFILNYSITDGSLPSENKAIELKEEINHDILGGAIIKVGDFQIDDSVRKQLKELKNSYNKNLFIKDF